MESEYMEMVSDGLIDHPDTAREASAYFDAFEAAQARGLAFDACNRAGIRAVEDLEL